jgi:hypothetical protein
MSFINKNIAIHVCSGQFSLDSASGQRDFDPHASCKALLLHNPVYNQTCLHRSWILIYHCAGI